VELGDSLGWEDGMAEIEGLMEGWELGELLMDGA